jgi:thioredoxin 1
MATATVSDDTFEADVLKEIAKELNGKVKIVKLNIDENHRTPSRYNVRAIPTLMIFKDGQLAATQTGALPKGRLTDWISGTIGVAAV